MQGEAQEFFAPWVPCIPSCRGPGGASDVQRSWHGLPERAPSLVVTHLSAQGSEPHACRCPAGRCLPPATGVTA